MNSKLKEKQFVMTRSFILLMAIVCGVSVANLYYIQPLEAQISATFHVSQSAAGIAAMLTQLGYAFGLLLFVPLGDICERRSLILRMLLLVAISLLTAGLSPCYTVLLIAMFAVGITTIVPQLIVPYAAHLSRREEQGKIIGYVMSGLLIGILLSRTFSGLVGAALNWRAVTFLQPDLSLFYRFWSGVFSRKASRLQRFHIKSYSNQYLVSLRGNALCVKRLSMVFSCLVRSARSGLL